MAPSDLSSVAENAEGDEQEADDEEEAGNNEESGRVQPSPGGLSQMSGTTAITSASAQTSHTVTEITKLDPTMLVEVLPGIWASSLSLLELLAPSQVSKDSVEIIVTELKKPGSDMAKIMTYRERKFVSDRESYGSDYYVRTSFVLQKLFGPHLEPGLPRPDAILQAANLATLVKDLLVSPKEAVDTHHLFSNLDTWFPESFITQFDDNVYLGNSTMLDECLILALEIRTQAAIVALLYHKSSGREWQPDEILTEQFFEPLAKREPRFSHYDDMTKNGQVKNLMRGGPDNTDDQEAKIRERVAAIREAFRQSEDAAQAGDLVDFDLLEESFPWLDFLTTTVQWTRFRIEEIEESVRQQGGVDSITQSLESWRQEAIRRNDSQADPNSEQQPTTATPRQLLPPANIVPRTTGHRYVYFVFNQIIH